VAATSRDLLAVRSARITILTTFALSDPAEKALAISAAIAGRLDGIALLASSRLYRAEEGAGSPAPLIHTGFNGPLFLIALSVDICGGGRRNVYDSPHCGICRAGAGCARRRDAGPIRAMDITFQVCFTRCSSIGRNHADGSKEP